MAADPNGASEAFALEHYFRRILGSGGIILAGSILGAMAGIGTSQLAPVTYEATATLLVSVPRFGLEQPSIRVAEFQPFLENRALASRVLEEFELDQPPRSMHPITFLANNVSVQQLQGTNVLNLRVRMDDPELAARLANRIAELAIELNQSILEEEKATNEKFILDLLAESRRRVDEDTAAEGRSRPEGGNRGSAGGTSAQGGLDALAGPIAEYLELYRRQVEPTEEELDRDVSRAVYTTLLQLYEESDLDVFLRSARLQLIDPAIAPQEPLSGQRGEIANTILGCLFGFLLAVIGILFYQYLIAARGAANRNVEAS